MAVPAIANAQQRLAPTRTWFTEADIPEGRLKPGSFARVEVRYDITTDGTVENCIVKWSDDSTLGKLTCRLLRERARYRPAFNREGQPVRSRDMLTVEWGRAPAVTLAVVDYGGAVPANPEENWVGLYDMPREPDQSGKALLAFEIDTQGRIGRCQSIGGIGDPKVPERVCESWRARARFTPPVNAKGEPYAVVGLRKIEWRGLRRLPPRD